jgi:hypothetical protein
MFLEKMRDAVVASVLANRIPDYIEESSEEFDPTREYQSYADAIYNKIVSNNFDIENDPRIQQIALNICNEAIKAVLLGLSNVSTQSPSERVDELLESELGIKKPEQK